MKILVHPACLNHNLFKSTCFAVTILKNQYEDLLVTGFPNCSMLITCTDFYLGGFTMQPRGISLDNNKKI